MTNKMTELRIKTPDIREWAIESGRDERTQYMVEEMFFGKNGEDDYKVH